MTSTVLSRKRRFFGGLSNDADVFAGVLWLDVTAGALVAETDFFGNPVDAHQREKHRRCQEQRQQDEQEDRYADDDEKRQ